MSLTSFKALEYLRKGATIQVGPIGAFLTTADGWTARVHIGSFRALRRSKVLRRLEPYDGEFKAVTHWTIIPKETP